MRKFNISDDVYVRVCGCILVSDKLFQHITYKPGRKFWPKPIILIFYSSVLVVPVSPIIPMLHLGRKTETLETFTHAAKLIPGERGK